MDQNISPNKGPGAERGMDGLMNQIMKVFTYGGLHQYLATTPHPDIDVVAEYLYAIERGDDLYHRNEDAQVKAYALLQKLQLMKENKQFYFSR